MRFDTENKWKDFIETPSENYYMLGFFRYMVDPIRKITIPIGVVACSSVDKFYKIRFPESLEELPKEIEDKEIALGIINAEVDSLKEMFDNPNHRPLWMHGKPMPMPWEHRFWAFHSRILCHNISLEELTTCEPYGNTKLALNSTVESEFAAKVLRFCV